MNETEDLPSHICVRPCVGGNSSSEHFSFGFCVNRCNDSICTPLNDTPGASVISPLLLSITGISGQIAALIYLHRGSRPASHRTTFYVMLTTLIWTDLVGKLITTPQPVISYVHKQWIGGELTCNLHGYSMSMIGIVTHLLVAAMAVERYLGIRCGYFYNRNVTLFRTRVMLIGILLFGIIYCTMPFVGVGEFKLHYPGSWCHINQHICDDHPLRTKIFSNLYSTINLACLISLVYCNFVVVGTLLKMRMSQYRPQNSCRNMSSRRPREKEIQMVILLLIITVTFIFSWAPHDILMFKNQLWPAPANKIPIFDIRAIRLVAINQIVDPWSYIICRIIFRSKLWGCCRTVIIGKVGSIRFTSRVEGEENLSFYSIPTGKLRLSSLKKIHKRTSLPNPGEIEIRARMEQEKLERAKRSRPSFETTISSGSEQDCKIDLQSCFPAQWNKEKTSPLTTKFARLFQSRHKNKSNNKQDSVEGQALRSPPTTIDSLLPTCSAESYTIQNLLEPETSKKGAEENVSCGNLVFKTEDTGLPVIEGSDFPPPEILTRSNSWSCSESYRLNKKSPFLDNCLKKRKRGLKIEVE